jgi:hypothetical protein
MEVGTSKINIDLINLIVDLFTKITKSSEIIILTMLAINAVAAIFIPSVTMRNIWRLWNTLSLFCYYPLLNIAYPANAMLMCSTISDIVNMKFINIESIMDKLISTKYETPLTPNFVLLHFTSV